MADDTPGTSTGQTIESNADAVEPQTTGEPAAPTPPAEPQTQDNAAAAAARREADAKRRAAEKRAAELEAELQKYRDEAQARKDAELSEIERANKAAAEAAAKAADAEARAAAAEIARTRADLIAADPEAAALPAAYKALVTGTDPETLAESLAATKAQFAADREAILAGAAGKPPSLGTPSAVPAQPTAAPSSGEWDDNNPATHTPENWRKERARRGIGAL